MGNVYQRILFDMAKRPAMDAAVRFRGRLEQLGLRDYRGPFVNTVGKVFMDVRLEDDAARRGVSEAASLVGGTLGEPVEPVALDECLVCGNVADEPCAVCPNCGFREIEPCPNCGAQIARMRYTRAEPGWHRCPSCHTRVILSYNEPIWRPEGGYREPIVLVNPA
jgi:hypothetical protein